MDTPNQDGQIPRTLYQDHAMTLSQMQIDARLEEYRRVRPDPGRDELTLLETALFVEEAFGILLSDDDIVPQTLGTYAAMRRFIAAWQGR
jgi:hypothetical protein